MAHIFTFLKHEELDFEEAELSKKRCEWVQLMPKGDTPNLVNTFTINLLSTACAHFTYRGILTSGVVHDLIIRAGCPVMPIFP